MVLTHTHLDHIGRVPRLVKQGFQGPVYCTPPTRELAEILLLDAAHLQQEDAAYLNRKGLTKHTPALPLFDETDVNEAHGALPSRAPRPAAGGEPRVLVRLPRRRPPPRRGVRRGAGARGGARDPRPLQRRRGSLRRRPDQGPRSRRGRRLPRRREHVREPHAPGPAGPGPAGGGAQEDLRPGRRAPDPGLRGGPGAADDLPHGPAGDGGPGARLPDPRGQPDGDRRHPHLRGPPRGLEGEPQQHRRTQPPPRQVDPPAPHARRVRGPQHDEGAGGHHLLERHARRRPHPPSLPACASPTPRTRSSSPATRRRGRWAGPFSTAPTWCASTRGTCRCWPRSAT